MCSTTEFIKSKVGMLMIEEKYIKSGMNTSENSSVFSASTIHRNMKSMKY